MSEEEATYQAGQSVCVVPGLQNNTPRRGAIRKLIWHHKDRCFDYYIRVCDKNVSKRYRDSDLVPDKIDTKWISNTVLGLAAGIRKDAAFDRLPILADALQDAGCEDSDILNHCRSDGPHVRGCWVVDLLLGKK